MPYKMITNVGKLCGRLAGAAFEHRDLIVGSLVDRWHDRLPETEDLSTVHLILTLVGEDLHNKHNELVAIEDDLSSELREDRQTRSQRDASLLEVRQLLIDSKRLLEVYYGPGSVETFWEEVDIEVPLDPEALFRVATRFRRNLLNPDFPRPPLKLGIPVDLEPFAHRFGEPLGVLGGSVRELHQSTQGSNASLAAKDRELGLEQKQAILAARLLEAITAYAGHEGVAKRIRLSRRRGNTSGDASDVSTTGDSSETSGDNPPTDAEPAVPASDGSASDGSAPDGATPDGATPDGAATDGSARDAPASDGDAPEGSASGEAASGGAASGRRPNRGSGNGAQRSPSPPNEASPSGTAKPEPAPPID